MNRQTAKGVRRLRKLAAHLMSKNRGLGRFDFNHVHRDDNGCGTCGCAMGELEFCFPKKFQRVNLRGSGPDEKETQSVYLKDHVPPCYWAPLVALTGANQFFGLTKSMGYHLFFPDMQHRAFGRRILTEASKARTVAAHIRDFCARAEAGKFTLDPEV